MNSQFLRLNTSDFVKGLIVAIAASVVTYLASALNAPGFDWTTLDWNYILKIAFTSFMGYISKNLLSNSEGKVFGKI